jgi:predicted nuclease of predicted toxin-antitoxin system
MFLANENFPVPSIDLLRNNDYGVRSIQEASPGISDEEVLNIAVNDNFIILTFDKDYGDLIFRYKLQTRKFPGSCFLYRKRTISFICW